MLYIGELGRMVGIKCPTSQRVTPAGRHSFATTLGGEVKAQVGPPAKRVWDLELGVLSTPTEVGTLTDFSAGAWGPGPFWFVSADASLVNVLTPGAASCAPEHVTATEGAKILGSPPMRLDDGLWAARSVWKTADGYVNFDPTPVLPSSPVTGAAWVSGAGMLRLSFLDSAGSVISSVWSDVPVEQVQRVSVSGVAPEGAAAVRLSATHGITQVARPTVTWTDTAYEWGDGQGCSKAVVHSVSRDVTTAWNTPNGGRWSGVSFVVQEIG